MAASVTRSIVCPLLIGRSSHLDTLVQFMELAYQGHGQTVLISGEAGIGKSRLIAETIRHALSYGGQHESPAALILEGRCFEPDLALPYAPFLDLLRSFLAAHSPDEVTALLGTTASELVKLLPEYAGYLPESAADTVLDPEQEKRKLFQTLLSFFTRQSMFQPLLVIIEDIHWSDDNSLEFLLFLARHLATHPILLLLTYRGEENNPSLLQFLAGLDRERLTTELALTHLSIDEVEVMIRTIFGLSRAVGTDFVSAIYTSTEGNPFFIEEMLKSLVASGEIIYGDGKWERKFHESESLQGVSLPNHPHLPRSTLLAVQQRLHHVSVEARDVLSFAAVLGRRFDFALLQHLTGRNESDLVRLVKELIAAQLIVEESEDVLAFRHALTRQAAYSDLLIRERRSLHHSVAQTMERLYANELDSHVGDLAYHYYMAGEWAKVLEYAQRAGEKAQALYAPRAAIEQLTRALDAAHHLGRVAAPKIYLALGQAYETLGEFEPARSDYERALEVARSIHDFAAEWQSLIALGFLWTGRDYSQTGTYYRQALELARLQGDLLTLAHSLNRLGNWHLNIEQPREALGYHQEALTLFQQAHSAPGVAQTYDLLGMASLLGGDLVQGAVYYQQAVALFQELDDRQGLASSLATLAKLGGVYQSETSVPASISFAQSLHFGEQAIKIAREIGQRPAEAYTLVSLGQFLGPRGEYARAFELAHAGLSLSQQIEHRQFMTFGHWELGVLYLELLALPEAQQQLEHALALAHEVGSQYWIRLVSGFLALVYLLQQDFAQAVSILKTALPPDAPSQTSGQRLVWVARAELALARSDPGLALDITDRLIASAANLCGERAIPRLWKLRGEALAALQRAAEAEKTLQAAKVAAQAQGLRPMLWRICVSLGKLYQTQKRQGEAEQVFSTARMLIEELAVDVAEERLREHFLSQATVMLPPKRSLASGSNAKQVHYGLTARECEVAALVAQGKSNRVIAGELVVGVSTVEAHISHIFTKLGFVSRSQIAAWAVETGLALTQQDGEKTRPQP